MARTKKVNSVLAAFKSVDVIRVIVCSILGIVGAWFATTLALSGVARVKAPQSALMLMPRESTALASRADQLFATNPLKPPKAVKTLAIAALREQAINPKALRILGYYADVEGDTNKAERYVRMAQKLSRREPFTQLWLIEAAVRRNDTTKTLIHYDIALRTKPEVQALLFPRLLNAIEDQDIRAALKPYIRTKNGWGDDFLSFARAKSTNLPVLTDLVLETGGLVDQNNAKVLELGLLSRLVGEGHFADARRLFLQMPGAKPARMTSAAFDPSDRDARFGPMGWQLIEGPDAGGGFVAKADEVKSALSLYVNSATTRPIATKLLYLKPGNYAFMVRLASVDRGEGGFLRWQLRCPSVDSGVALWTVDSITPSLRASVTVPANCQVQFLDLIASGGKGQSGLEATVASVSVSPAGL
jgi:hypothetical protein